ncbi:MAG: UDP-N-acetylmuramoyl-L-alanine--D-glutamate ligase [Eubacteriaceae bacterium]|nr:UDP-N-acetylmuramoyl-L-alanine--D-glutamate ligase [Eubacteriaceae bacterium]
MDKKKYLVIGAARSGIAASIFLAQRGNEVILTDTKPYEALEKEGYGIENAVKLSNVTTVFGRQPYKEEVLSVGEVILSPGVPPDIAPCLTAVNNNIPLTSEVEFANRYFKGDIIAITGTNGKTTTTYLTAELMKAAGYDSFECGNIGIPFINRAEESTSQSVAALEISSFQLSMSDKLHPKVAVVTNITPDHLDRHKTMENYIAAKARVFENMEGSDLLILNYDDETVRAFGEKAKCTVKYFSLKNTEADAYLQEGGIYLKGKGKIINTGEMKIIGPHNAANAMCALLACGYYNADTAKLADALRKFTPVEHRVEFVREINGVKFVNDSKGTNPDATITAINSFDCPLVMILGGYDKKNDFDEMFELLKGKARYLVIIGQTAQKLIDTAEKFGFKDYCKEDSFEQAVKTAYGKAKSGDCVLLSPACASWGMFENFEQRGEIFKQIVNDL